MTDAIIRPGWPPNWRSGTSSARIAILADQGDLDEYIADQFTEDAVWDLPPAPRQRAG